jgi:hypothetical protein
VAEDGMEAAGEAGFLPLRVLNAAMAGRARRELGQIEAALQLHRRAWDWARSLNEMAVQAASEELCADLAAAGRWDEAAPLAAESRRCWSEGKLFVHMSAWTVAEALLRAGAPYSPPDLAEGDRYRLVGLRVRAVVDRHAGRTAAADVALREAHELAVKLQLPLQAAALDPARAAPALR